MIGRRFLAPVLGSVRAQIQQPLSRAMAQAYAELNLLSTTLDSRISFTRASSKTYVGADGLLKTAANDTCPLEYDPVTLQPVGRSFWEARTNLLLQSGAPATQGITTTVQSYTLSFTGTGTVTLSGAYTGSKTGTGGGPANRVNLTFAATAGTLTVTPSGDVENFQLEAATTPGPYIPTTTAQVTRAADVAWVNDLSTLRFNQTAWSIFSEYFLGSLSPNDVYVCRLSQNSTVYAAVRVRTPDSMNIAIIRGTSNADIPTNRLVVAGSRYKFVIGYNATSGNSVSLNGSAALSSAAAGNIAATQLFLGGFNGSGSNVTIRRIRYYPRKLSDTELQALTT